MLEASVGEREGKFYKIFLSAINTGDQPVNVSPAQITATQGLERLHVLTVAEAKKRLDRRQFWENVAVGLAAGADAYATGASNAGQTTLHGSYSGNIYSLHSGSRYRTSGSFTATYTDPAARQAALDARHARSMEMFDQMSTSHSSQDDTLSTLYFADHTLGPDEGYTGYVLLKRPNRRGNRSGPIDLAVRMGGRTMTFRLSPPA